MKGTILMSKNPHQALLSSRKCCADLNECIGHQVGWKTMYPYSSYLSLVVRPIGSNFAIFSVGFWLFSFGGKVVTILCMRSREIKILCLYLSSSI